MAAPTPHLSKTDLRRGLFTKPAAAPAPAPAPTPKTFPAATSPEEQALLFDLAPFASPAKTRAPKKDQSRR